MAIENLDGGGIITPSIMKVIEQKGWRVGGTLTPGRWPSTDGLVKLSHYSDINPFFNTSVKTTPPYSLYSFKGYNHFYKVYPHGAIQNLKGRPDDSSDYHDRIDDDLEDTAYIQLENPIPARGDICYFYFDWLPKSYSIGGSAKIENKSDDNNPNGEWMSVDISPDFKNITVAVKENTTSSVRSGYFNVRYLCANPIFPGSDRRFGFYIKQLKYTGSDPGDPGRPDVPYKDFKIYYNNQFFTQIGENTGSTPLLINDIGSFTLTIGGELLLSNIIVDNDENGNPGLTYEVSKDSTIGKDGSVGHIKLTVEANCQTSKLGFTIINSRGRFTYYVGYVKN